MAQQTSLHFSPRRHFRLPLPLPLAVATVVLMVAVVVPSLKLRAESPEVLVELDREQVFVGEAVHYRVLLNHCGMQAKPDMSALEQFDVQLVSRSEVETTRLLDNGRERQRLVRIGPLFEFKLTPSTAGTLKIPSPSVEVDGKRYVGKTLTLKVADASEQDLVYMAVTTEPESVYPMQPLRIRLTLAVKGLPDPASDTDPLQLRRTLPSLTIPWANDEQLDDALQPKEPLNRWIQQYINESSYGVAINDYEQAGGLSGFSGFFSSRRDSRLAFRSTPRRVLREDGRGGKVEYWEYVFVRTVIPQRSGNVSLGNVTLKGQFAARINTRGNVELDPVYVIARPPELVIRQPPMAGRPATFTGAIGSFVGGAELSPAEASVGDPMTLTVWVRGAGTLSETTAPDLANNATIAEQFKVYEATEKTEEDTRRFTFSLRPKTATTKQFPAIPILTYFDVNQEKYVTLESDPIPITIASASQLASSEIAMATSSSNAGQEIGTRSEGIFANVTDLSQLRNDGVNLNRWFLNLGGLAGLFVVIAFATQRLQRVREDTGLQRRRSALARARRRLEAKASSREAADSISGALVGLVADTCDLTEDGLTSADAASALAARNVSPAVVTRLQEVLETCDAARYASMGTEADTLRSEALALFAELTQELRSRKLIT